MAIKRTLLILLAIGFHSSVAVAAEIQRPPRNAGESAEAYLARVQALTLAQVNAEAAAPTSEGEGPAPGSSAEAMDKLLKEYERTKKEAEEDPTAWLLKLTFPGPGGWELISVTDNDAQADFATRRNARREGSLATVWIRSEYKEARRYQSMAMFTEFDCRNMTMRALSGVYFSKADMEGESTTAAPEKDAAPVLPGTNGESWLRWACAATKPKPAAKPAAPASGR